MIHFRQGVGQRGRSLDIVGTAIGMDRSHVVRNGFPFGPSIQRSIGCHAHSHVGVYGIYPRAEFSPPLILPAGNVTAVAFEHILEQGICIIIIIPIMMDFGAVDQCIQFFMALPIVFDGLEQFSSRCLLFIEHQLFDGSQAVSTSPQPGSLRPDAVDFGTPMSQIFPGPDAVLEEAGYIGQRFPVLMRPVDDIFTAAQLVGPVFELLIHTFQHFVEGLVRQEASRIGPILGLIIIQEFPAVEDHFHHLGGIYISCIMPAVFFPRNIDFHTAHHTIFPCIF